MTGYELPTQTIVLGDEYERVCNRVEELEKHTDADADASDASEATAGGSDDAENAGLDGDEDLTLARARRDKKALALAIYGDERTEFDGWGEDAVVELQAHATDTRDRTVDAFNETIINGGQNQLNTWLFAAAIIDAPWIDDKDIKSRATATGALQPQISDWLQDRVNDLNGIKPGN